MDAAEDDRRVPRFSAPSERQEIPPLDGGALLRLHNARQFAGVISRLLAQSLPGEVARERATFIRAAVRLAAPPTSKTAQIRDLHSRLQRLAAVPLPVYIDGGTSDGALCVVLLLSSGKAPSLSTVQRALTLHAVGGSEVGLL